jgi:hypothetical protein
LARLTAMEPLPPLHRRRPRTDWRSRLRTYVEGQGGGAVFIGVPVAGPFGPWPLETPRQDVDAVWFPNTSPLEEILWRRGTPERFLEALQQARPVLIRPRGSLDRLVFGRLISGRLLLARSYGIEEAPRCIALSETGSGIKQVYAEHRIECVTPQEAPASTRSGPSSSNAREDELLRT